MSGKRKEPIIESVCFYYNGSDSQFNVFLKSVIRAYLADEMPAVGIRPIENNTGKEMDYARMALLPPVP